MQWGHHISWIAVTVSACLTLDGCTRMAPQLEPGADRSDAGMAVREPRLGDATSSRHTANAVASQRVEEAVGVPEVKPVPDLWDRIRNGFDILPSLANDRHLRTRTRDFWFGLQQPYVDQIAQRAQPYLHHIVEEIERRGIPMEIALLPIVESQFQPEALSPVNAAGIWQMIPATGKRFGLKQNAWYDGRKDIIASTAAALTYLQFLHARFHGDWLKALAAYNCGEGLVDAAIEANRAHGRATDFWSLHLPGETRNYVPRLLAVASLVADPEQYNVALQPIENRPYLVELRVNGQIKLDKVAKLADLSLRELRALNPGFQGASTEPKGQASLLLPVGNVNKLQQGIASLPPALRRIATVEPQAPAVATPEHSLARGDAFLAAVSQHGAGTPVELAEQPYQQQPTEAYRASGMRLDAMRSASSYGHWTEDVNLTERPQGRFFRTANDTTFQFERVNLVASRTTNDPNSSARYVRYRVREGDSLWLISQRFRVTVEQICRWNALTRRAPELEPGHILHIYANTGSV